MARWASKPNYLLRLGWSHGDEEIIDMEQAIQWFDLDAVGRAPAKFDMDKLLNLNGHYLNEADDDRLLALVLPGMAEKAGVELTETAGERLKMGMILLKERAKTVPELIESGLFFTLKRPIALNDKATKLLDGGGVDMVKLARDRLAGLTDWSVALIEEEVRHAASEAEQKLGAITQPLRAALTGSNVSPGIFEVIQVLGQVETLGRLDDVLARRR